MDRNTEAVVLTSPYIDMSFGHEGGGDFSLPDYLPEIQRLISVNATVLPEGKFLSGNVLELGGTLAYSVLYAGEGGEVSCASFAAEYSADTALPAAVENSGDIFTDCEIESTASRVTGPRSISIKSRLKSRIMSDCRQDICGEILDFDGKAAAVNLSDTVEKLTGDIESLTRCHGLVTGNATGDIRCEGDEGDAWKPVMCDCSVFVERCRAYEDSASVTGQIMGSCLFSHDNKYKSVPVKIPFESTVHMREAAENSLCRAWGRVASVSVSKSETDDSFNIFCEYDLEAEAIGKSNGELCFDAYSTSFDCENEGREEDFLRLVAAGGGRMTVSGECELKGDGAVAVTVGGVSGVQIAVSEERAFVVGNIKLKSAVVNGGECNVAECEIPFKYELPEKCSAAKGDMQSRAVASVLSCEGKISGDKVIMSAELALSYELAEKQRVKYLTCVKLKDQNPVMAVGRGVKVYYPQKEESLWDVCKKYHANRSRVMRHNGISGETVPQGKPVIIM